MIIDIITLKHSQKELVKLFSVNENIALNGIMIHPVLQKSGYRSIDPSSIQAILTLTSVGIGALLKGIFDIAKEKIILEVKNDDFSIKVDIPKNFSQTKLEELLALLKRASSASIFIDK